MSANYSMHAVCVHADTTLPLRQLFLKREMSLKYNCAEDDLVTPYFKRGRLTHTIPHCGT